MISTSSPIRKISAALPVDDASPVYRNPLPVEDAPETFHPDPYVIKHNGMFYCYSTGLDGIPVLVSKDLCEWKHAGYALRTEGHVDFWAPSVFYRNGVFYMYYSSREDLGDDVHEERLKVAISEDPCGPFRFVKTLYDTFSIDAHVVQDSAGLLYLFYSTNDYAGTDADRPGTVILLDRLTDPLTPEGNPQVVVVPTMDEEIFEENRFGDGRDWHTIEGAFYLERKGMAHVMYSGNAYTKPYYYIGVAEGSEPIRNDSWQDVKWQKLPDAFTYEPLLKRNAFVEGVGHNSVITGPNNVEDWIVYHGRDGTRMPVAGKEERELRIDRLAWCGKRMWVPGPSSVPQRSPAQPILMERFEEVHGEGLGPLWTPLTGCWSGGRGEGRQSSVRGFGEALATVALEYYLFEVNARWEPSHLGGLYGAYVYYKDASNHVRIILDAGKRCMCLIRTMGGISEEAASASLPRDFRFDCYHQLLIRRTGGRVDVRLDGVRLLEGMVPEGAARVGLFTQYTAASFAGITVTGLLELDGDTQSQWLRLAELEPGAPALPPVWTVSGGTLHCHTRKDWREVRFRPGSTGTNWECSGDAALSSRDHDAGFGMLLAGSEGRMLRLFVGGDEKLLRLEETDPSGECRTWSHPLPEGLNLQAANTLWVRQYEGQLAVLLNDWMLFEGTSIGELECFGLSSNRDAHFSHLRLCW